MQLSKYLKARRGKVTIAAFAEQIGVHRTTIYRFKNGAMFPRSDVLERITVATGGAVTANDFMAARQPRKDAHA